MRRRVTLVTLVVLASVSLVASARAQDGASDLEQAKRRIAEVAEQLSGARAQAQSADAALADADARLAELEAAVNQAAEAVDRQRLAVQTAGDRLAALEAEAGRVADAVQVRAVDLFKRGSGLPFDVVLGAGDIGEALERTEFLRVVTHADTANLEGLTVAQEAVDAERGRYEAKLADLERMQAEQQQLLAQVAELRRNRALQAAAARQRVHDLEAEKEDLEEDAARLTRLIRARQRSSRYTGSPSTSGYIWPRCDTVTSEFGRRWGRLHAGIDIDGNTGDPVGAAKSGVVIYADWRSGYGRLVLVDHGDGVVTGYAHMSAFSVRAGDAVSRGQRVGSVGSTGNSTGSHLHFETRVNGSPVNPRRFLPSSC